MSARVWLVGIALTFAILPLTGDSENPLYGHADWWFDRSTGSICWYGGENFSAPMGVDLDGDHTTVASSSFGISTSVGKNVAPEINFWDEANQTWHIQFLLNATGRLARFAEREIVHPVPQSRAGSEYFHFFSRLKDPPTDFVVGLRDADASGNSLPIARPFWISLNAPGANRPGNWTLIDPADPPREGDCRPWDWVNRPPVASLSAAPVPEGQAMLLDASASSDPDANPLQFRWDFEGDGTWDTPYSTGPTATAPWGDDYSGTAVVEVFDGTDAATAAVAVSVSNVAPSLSPIDVTAGRGEATLTLRVAGEKFHDVTATLSRNGNAVATATILRVPGSPDAQSMTLGTVTRSADAYAVEVVYTPLDDAINGQVHGADPAWLILSQNGVEVRLHHPFNVRHPDTWTWTVDDLGQYVQPAGVQLAFEVSDPGSDDLTVTIDWGDNTTDTFSFPNNASLGADPDPSPDLNPRLVTVTTVHAYAAPGTYTVTVTVEDDDGGVTTAIVTITV